MKTILLYALGIGGPIVIVALAVGLGVRAGRKRVQEES